MKRAAIIGAYADWLTYEIPKLWIQGDPGMVMTPRLAEITAAWPNQTHVTVNGLHFLQEDSPDEIGIAVADFVIGLRGA